MIAMALACRPELLIADEPTTALDVTTQARILDLINELQQELELAVLYISHDLHVVRSVSRRVAVMYAGQLVEVAPTDVLFDSPRHPYTRGLIAAATFQTSRDSKTRFITIDGTVPELIEPKPSCRFNSRCSFAHDPCFQAAPALEPQNEVGHEAACFLLSEPEGRVMARVDQSL
jgi:oligopeptide/dipeptide ABC transporter ATP-binding protein